MTLNKRVLARAAFATALLLASSVGSPTFAAAVKPAAAPAVANAAENRFEVGTLLVERHGDHGKPLILIPGLASGAWAWSGVVKQLEGAHVVYVVTLAGFDGRTPVAGQVMPQALQSLKDLIRTRKLDKPVLIGHSLGGILSIALAQSDSSLVAGVISIDGLPVFPGTEAMPAQQRSAMAEGIKAQMTGLGREQFAAMQLQYMRAIGVLDADMAQQLATHSSRSDPDAAAQYMAEILSLDLRPGMAGISVPVLLLSPYNAADGAILRMQEADKTAYYRSLMAGTPKLDVVSIAPSRHFAMFDQPRLVGDAISNYLQALVGP